MLKTLWGGDRPFDATDKPVSIDGMDMVLDVLCPDWDILIEIQHALKQLPELQLKFIKGHQDDKIPYAQLPLLARLNVDADAMAGSYQDCHGQDRPVALIMPRTRVQLHLLEGTVTSSHAATLRHAYCGQPLLEAVRIKNSWSEATVTSINWQAHGSALRKQMPRRIHFVKLVHDILPTHASRIEWTKASVYARAAHPYTKTAITSSVARTRYVLGGVTHSWIRCRTRALHITRMRHFNSYCWRWSVSGWIRTIHLSPKCNQQGIQRNCIS